MRHEPLVLPPAASLTTRQGMVEAANLALDYILELQGLATLLEWEDLAEILGVVVDAGDVIDPVMFKDGGS